jgi:uncharacterized protein (DUF1501 family)
MTTLTRREALGALAAAGAAGLSWPGLARAQARRPRLVVLVLSGGLDGLAALPPHGDPHYETVRGALALRRGRGETRLLDLDGFFGLHPALAPLRPFYARGECLAVPAVATSNRERSHAAAQAALRQGAAGCGAGDWTVRALAGSAGAAPLDLCGERPSSGRADLIADLSLASPVVDRSFFVGATAMSGAGRAPADPVEAALAHEIGAFREAARRTGEHLAGPEAPAVARLTMAGFDTHVAQGAADGRLATALAGLAEGLGDLACACGAAWRDTVVMVVTEFGRTASANRLGGTDHGTAGTLLLLGGAVAGGRVLPAWPGLAPEALLDGRDLAPATEFRAIAKGILQDHLGLPAAFVRDVVFPGSSGISPLPGLVRT